MNSNLKKTAVGCQIVPDIGQNGIQAMTVTQSNQSAWTDSCLPIYSNVKHVESTSSHLSKLFSIVKNPISGIFHLGTGKIDEQR